MVKSAKNTEHNVRNHNKHLVETHFQNMLKILKNTKEKSFVNGDFSVKRKDAVLNGLDRLTSEHGHITDLEAKSFIEHELTPYVNYNDLDNDCDLRIGAALWILDKLSRRGKITEAYKILPNINMNIHLWYLPPDFSHPCFSNDLINSVIHVIAKRYPHIAPSDCIVNNENAKGIKPEKPYIQLMELLKDQEISEACRTFKEKLSDISLRYVRGNSFYEREIKTAEDSIKTALSTLEESDSVADDLTKADIFTQNAVRQKALRTNNNFLNSLSVSRLNSLTSQTEKLLKQKRDFFFKFDRYLQLDKKDVLSESDFQEIADCTDGFSVSDPYELCFALFYLLDTGDDAPWLMVSGRSLMLYVRRMLPWYVDKKNWDSEAFDSWYEGLDYSRNDWLSQNETDEVNFYQTKHCNKNLAQVIYDLTRTVIPAGMHPFDKDRLRLVKEGMDINLARKVTDIAEILFLYKFQCQQPTLSALDYDTDYYIEEADSSDEHENISVNSETKNSQKDSSNDLKVPSVSKVGGYWGKVLNTSDKEQISDHHETNQDLHPQQDVNKLKEEISALKQQIKALNQTLAVGRQQMFSKQAKYEHELKSLRLEHRELADLREIVFNQNADKDTVVKREKTEKSYTYPYATRKRTVIFGGHDSWLKTIKPMLPEAKFVDVDQYAFNHDLIRNADVVWIQTNYMSHAQFSNVIGRIRLYGIQVRYFTYASAEKCAEQLVTEDLKP